MGNTTAPTAVPTLAPGESGVYIDGGEGDDQVFIDKGYRNKVIIKGGPGNDTVTTVDGAPGMASLGIFGKNGGIPRLGMDGTLALAGLAIIFVTLGVIVWRALSTPDVKPD